MYELIILSLLMRWNAHGYLIASVINDIIGPYAKMSNGRLYPLLARLEEQGLIKTFVESEKASRGDRQHRSYVITEAGRKRFHDLMLDTTSNPGDYQKLFLQKVTVLEFLNPAERLYLIDHYINYCQAHVLHLTAEAEHLVRDVSDRGYMKASQLDATVNVMHHMAEQWELELAWARNLRKKEILQTEGQELEISDLQP